MVRELSAGKADILANAIKAFGQSHVALPLCSQLVEGLADIAKIAEPLQGGGVGIRGRHASGGEFSNLRIDMKTNFFVGIGCGIGAPEPPEASRAGRAVRGNRAHGACT
ncbi:MAG TPA: hypothetical protein VIJ16_04900 [Gemmatimonadaceae bacterium]